VSRGASAPGFLLFHSLRPKRGRAERRSTPFCLLAAPDTRARQSRGVRTRSPRSKKTAAARCARSS